MKIKEGMKVDNGKLIYCISMEQGKGKLHVYIGRNNNLEFADNRFFETVDFDLSDENHKVAKEIFLTYLQADIKSSILYLKQLELILDQLGLLGIIRNTISENGSILIDNKEDIITASIERSEEIIKGDIKKSEAKMAKKVDKTKKEILKEAENIASDVVGSKVKKIAQKKEK